MFNLVVCTFEEPIVKNGHFAFRTIEHDDCVVPAHSFKYIARLQEVNSSEYPMLIRIEENAGHDTGKTVDEILDEAANKYTFLFHHVK